MKKETWSEGHKVLTLGPHTGHIVSPIAYCKDSETAVVLSAAFDLLEMAKWAESAISPFSKDPSEKSGISRLRTAIAKAEGKL